MAFDSAGLIAAAKSLISDPSPSHAHIARSVSTAYYAIFQHTCCATAALLIGGNDGYLTRAKAHLMRSIGHKALNKRMGQAQTTNLGFPRELKDYANTFCTMQKNRHDADYDTAKSFTKSDALNFITQIECAISEFDAVQKKHRLSFLVWAILDKPNH